MDTTMSNSERREQIRRDRHEEKRLREIDDGIRYIQQSFDVVLDRAIGDYGLTWHEAMDCLGAAWDAENATKHLPRSKP